MLEGGTLLRLENVVYKSHLAEFALATLKAAAGRRTLEISNKTKGGW